MTDAGGKLPHDDAPTVPGVGAKLDRLQHHDERSRAYGVQPLLATAAPRQPRGRGWWLPITALDQGREGACVGYSWAQELAAVPGMVRGVTGAHARQLYRRAQQLDTWPGEEPAYSGTSVLAGAKAVQELGALREYRWAFGLDDLLLALSYIGPAVLGVPWLSGMARPDPDGMLHATGQVLGGHAILAVGLSVRDRTVTLANSWGPGWGRAGRCRISWDDLGRLLADGGEACVPLTRRALVLP